MPKGMHEGGICDTKSKRLNKELSVDKAKTEIVNKIIEQIKEVLEDPVKEKDSTNDLRDTIKKIFQSILGEFTELIGENNDKKLFIGDLIKIFMILLSSRTKVQIKIKKVLRVSTKIALDLWPEQKPT